MSWEAWLTLAVVVAVLAGLARGWAPPVVILAGLAVLMTTQSLTGSHLLVSPAQAVAGFGNTGLVTVGLLFVVVAGLIHTGAVTMLTEPLLGRPKSLLTAQLRLLFPVVGLSAFLNNTPIVAMFMPVVSDLCRRTRLPPSKLFLPLSYASIFGGTCTLIGTSTNLVVNGMLTDQAGLPSLGIFDLAWVGIPVALIGLLYIFAFSAWLLPSNASPVSREADPRRYTVEVMVQPDGAMVGRSIEQAGLRHLPELYLIEIQRGDAILTAVGPNELLRGGDRLIFVGVVESVVDLYRMRGLEPATHQVFKLDSPRGERCLVEAVVSPHCPLIGKSIREGRFRQEYNAVVIAAARGRKRLQGKIGDIVLQAGDTLLLEAHPSFLQRHRNSQDFYLASDVADSTPRQHDRAYVAMAVVAAMVILVATGVLSMLNAALLAAGVMLATGCTTGGQARGRIDWSVLVVIGAALGLGRGLEQSGAAQFIGHELVGWAGGAPFWVLVMVFAATSLFTEVITNNAAAVLMFPVAYSAAHSLGVSFLPFAITLMIAASASFATPIGYQTNLMVYGPGGYRFGDYLRFGLPLNLIVLVTTVAVVPRVWPF